MTPRRPSGRRVRHHPRFRKELARLERRDRRVREALAGLEAVLVRMPDEAGMAVPGEATWRQRPIHVGEHSYSVLYTFGDDEVLLLSLRQIATGIFE